jgi:hypothetical protein
MLFACDHIRSEPYTRMTMKKLNLLLAAGLAVSIQAFAAPVDVQGITYRYEPYSPTWSNYHDPEIGHSRVIDLKRLSTLTKATPPFHSGDALMGMAGLFDINVSFPVMIGYQRDESLPHIVVGKPGEKCEYKMQYLGDDARGDSFLKPIVMPGQNKIACEYFEVIRIEHRSANAYRISFHNTASGAEQWAAVIKQN